MKNRKVRIQIGTAQFETVFIEIILCNIRSYCHEEIQFQKDNPQGQSIDNPWDTIDFDFENNVGRYRKTKLHHRIIHNLQQERNLFCVNTIAALESFLYSFFPRSFGKFELIRQYWNPFKDCVDITPRNFDGEISINFYVAIRAKKSLPVWSRLHYKKKSWIPTYNTYQVQLNFVNIM